MVDISLVYLCGGISSRFGGEIKQFAIVGPNGETLIEYSILQAIKSLKEAEINIQIKNIIFIVSEKTSQKFHDFFSENSYMGIDILYAYQDYDKNSRDRPWGTADAFSCLKGIVVDPFIICNGDDIYGDEAFKISYIFLNQNRLSGNAAVAYTLNNLLPENPEETVNRGIFTLDTDFNIIGIKELLNISRNTLDENILDSKGSVNFMCLRPEVVDMVYEKNIKFKEDHKSDRQIEHFLPEVLSDLIKEGRLSMTCLTSSQKMVGITRPTDLEYVRSYLL